MAREAVLTRIDAWWEAFRERTEDLHALFKRKSEWDSPAWMAESLQAIHPHLMWEYGRAVTGDGHRLVITPESARHLRPLTTTIIERAPRIKGWEFYPHRLAEDVESMQAAVKARTGGTVDGVQVRVGRGEHNQVDTCFCSPRTARENDDHAFRVAFVAAETLLGEECLDKWIGAIDVSPLPNAGGLASLFRRRDSKGSLIPLDRLRETVDAVVESMRDQLPPYPHFDWVDKTKWTLWQLKPEEADDYPDQRDLFVGKSANPHMWTAAHGHGRFYSERFSRCGETFCYVKLDGSEGVDEEKFTGKAEIEEAIDDVLRPGKLGCQIGGGTGLRYSYIDLALCDLERGIDAVRQRLQQGNVPKRSWIQFFDADFAAEWVGVYDDSPPPPMSSFDE